MLCSDRNISFEDIAIRVDAASKENGHYFSKLVVAGNSYAMGNGTIPNAKLQKIRPRLFQSSIDASYLFVQEQICAVLADLDADRLSQQELKDLLIGKQEILQRLEQIAARLGEPYAIFLPWICNALVHGNEIEDSLLRIFSDLGTSLSNPDTINGIVGNEEFPPLIRIRILVAICLLLHRPGGKFAGDSGPTGINDLPGLLLNYDIDMYVRAGIARTLGVLGNADIAAKLLEYLDRHIDEDPKIDEFIKWHIVSALGVLGRRLGFRGETKIFEGLKCRLINHNGIGEYVRLNIATILTTEVFPFLDEIEPGDHPVLRHCDGITLTNPVVRAAVGVLEKGGSDEVFAAFFTTVAAHPPDNRWVWIYICEFVGRLANKEATLGVLDQHCQQCNHTPPAGGANDQHCETLQHEITEHFQQTKWMVISREKAGTVKECNDGW
jgi:hypothetical protein